MNFADAAHNSCPYESYRPVEETNIDQRITCKPMSNHNQVKVSYKELWGHLIARGSDLGRKLGVTFPKEVSWDLEDEWSYLVNRGGECVLSSGKGLCNY